MAKGRRAHLDEPAGDTYSLETTCVLTGMSVVRLTRYERARVIVPVRQGKRRFYRAEDIQRIRKAHRLEDDLGINLAGVEVILRLTDELEALHRRLATYEARSQHS